MNNRLVFIALLLCLSGSKSLAQLPMIDRGLMANNLWCFPLYGDSLRYVYLPLEADLVRNADGTPKFSYMRYVLNKATGTSTASTIQEGDGGALLNFLVRYHTPESAVKEAEQILRQKLKNDSVRIRGPLIPDKGRYSLVSSLITGDSLFNQKQMLSTGTAPVLENNAIALSFGLTPHTSKILSENFKMATPDISLVFDMEFSGLTEDFDAELDIDWKEVKNHQGFSAGGSVYFVSADVKIAFDELFKKQAIRLKVTGTNANLEALLNTVYDKLLTLLFEPVKPEQLPVGQQGNLVQAMAESLTGPNGILSSRQTTGFGVNVGYQLKEMKSTGSSKLLFKGRSTVQRHHYIAFNIGNLHQQYGNDTRFFRDAPLNDAAFQQRSIMVGIDGELEKEFDKMLNSVTVTLAKDHISGAKTIRNIIVTNQAAREKNIPAIVYGYNQDTTKWLEYKHKSVWQFRGGATYESEWLTQDASMISLYMPYRRKTIDLEGDLSFLDQSGVRAISIQIAYPFFNQTRQERITIRTTDTLSDRNFVITQPINEDNITYTITWLMKNGSKIEKNGTDTMGLIFIDELPKSH